MKNILLLVSDHHRGDWLPYPDTYYETSKMKKVEVRMPVVEDLMSKGTSFSNCITPSPLCAPARACLASGRDYEHCGVLNNSDNYPVEQRTFYSVLKEMGYSVGGVGKFDLHKPDHWWGLDGWVDDLGKMGFTYGIDNEGKIDGVNSGAQTPKGPYMKFLHDGGYVATYLEDMIHRMGDVLYSKHTLLPDEAYCDNWIGDNGCRMIRDFDPAKSWFLQVNFAGPHGPWDVTESMKARWEGEVFEEAVCNQKYDPQGVNGVKQNFASMLENIDANIGRLLDEIKKRGELDDTLILYTSDHGDMLGDHSLFGKCVPYYGSVSIPLVVWGRDVCKNTIREDRVSLHDLAATIVEYAGGEMKEARESESLMPLLTGTGDYSKKQQVSGLRNSKYNWNMVIEDNIKSIYNEGTLEEKFRIDDDPYELVNLAASTL